MKKSIKFFVFLISFIVITLLVATVSYASTSMQSNCYKITNYNNSTYILGIVDGTLISELSNNLISSENIELYTSNNTLIENDSIVKTGMYIKHGQSKYILVVSGDVNGDGTANQTDLFKIRSHLVGLTNLSNEYLLASNINIDSKTSSTDILQLKKDLVNLINIKDLYQENKSNSRI